MFVKGNGVARPARSRSEPGGFDLSPRADTPTLPKGRSTATRTDRVIAAGAGAWRWRLRYGCGPVQAPWAEPTVCLTRHHIGARARHRRRSPDRPIVIHADERVAARGRPVPGHLAVRSQPPRPTGAPMEPPRHGSRPHAPSPASSREHAPFSCRPGRSRWDVASSSPGAGACSGPAGLARHDTPNTKTSGMSFQCMAFIV